jgi:acetoin utilization deacetylase AcuC-like enzyme
MSTGLLYDPRFLDHDPGPGHPERRERLSATLGHLERQAWFEHIDRVAPHPADEAWIETTHSHALLARARAACREGASFLDVTDVGICSASFDIALLAAGGALELCDRVAGGQLDNGFALMRPPGHHAERDMALGFCLFNNVAIAARYLQRHHGIDKVAILDWDVHHGNGTQHTFEEDPSVLYVSLHQYPYYPGTGAASETGSGAGAGATLNCPMPAGAGDAEYEHAFVDRVLPKIDAFAPQLVLLSAGFDAHADDPLAQMRLSTAFYGWMTDRVIELSHKHAHGRIVSLLEGGYNIGALPLCVEAHLARLAAGTA